MDKFIIYLTAKKERLENISTEKVIANIKIGIEEICGEIFDVEVEERK